MSKASTIENFEIEHNGITYLGERVIVGTNRLDQYVIFDGLCLTDLAGYDPADKDGQMLIIAKQMLFELATGRTISAKHRSAYGV